MIKILSIIFIISSNLILEHPLCKDLEYSDLNYRNQLFYSRSEDLPYTGSVTGTVRAELVNGVYDGPYQQYYANGQTRMMGIYKNGKKEGLWISYHQNGQLHSKGIYRDGVWEGTWVDYYEDGSVRSKMRYLNGKEIQNH